MSLAQVLTIEKDDASPHLQRLTAAIRHPDVRKTMGRAVATRVKKHFASLDRERPNAMGGERTHFYEGAASAVQQPQLVGGDAVRVDINHLGIAQRFYGGEITPQHGNWLTIPARAEAYGHRAREFSDLHFVLFRNDLAGLVQTEGDTGRGSVDSRGEGGGVFYWLVTRVYQKPDPTVLPPADELRDEALAAGDDYFQTILARAAS